MEEIKLRDLINMLIKRKASICVTTVIVTVLAVLVSLLLTPKYVSPVELELGDFKNDMYSKPVSVRQILVSNDFLEPIMRDLMLDQYASAEDFARSITIEPIDNTNSIKVIVSYKDPKTAKEIASRLVDVFMKKSDAAFQEKKGPLDEYVQTSKSQQELLVQSIERNKKALVALEENQAIPVIEKDLARTRLIELISKDEQLNVTMSENIKSAQVELASYRKAVVLTTPAVIDKKQSPNLLLNTAAAVVVGLMIGIFVAIIREYFEQNPLATKERKERGQRISS